MSFLNRISIKQRLFINIFAFLLSLLLLFIVMYQESVSLSHLGEVRANLTSLEVDVLQLRRSEKDFLARKDLKYVEKFETTYRNLLEDIQTVESGFDEFDMDKAELTTFNKVARTYKQQFEKLVKIQKEIGLDPKSGAYGALRAAVHDVEDALKSVNSDKSLVDVLQLRRTEKDFMLRLDEKYIDRFANQISSFKLSISTSDLPPEVKQQIKNSLNSYQTNFDALVQNQIDLGLTPKSGALGVLRSTVHQTDEALANMLLHSNETVDEIFNNMLITAIIIFLSISAVTIWLALVISNSIIKPIDATCEFIDNVRNNNDLTIRMPESGNDELSKLVHNFNSLMSEFQEMISYINQTASTIDEAMVELGRTTEATNEGMLSQQQESEMVATAATEMQSTIEDIARNTESAANKAEVTNQNATEGHEQVMKTVADINSLSSKLTDAATVVSQLEEDSTTIGSVLGVIRGIAEQTNLLALNAAIEAARAGEQGRGFAVVADEVRNLAMRTQESTQEIENIITALQSRTNEIVSVMEVCRKEGQESSVQAETAGSRLSEITTNMTDILDMNTMIAAAIEEQNMVATEVNKNVVHIRDIALEVKDMSETNSATSHEISQQMSILHDAVIKFKVV